MIQAGSNFGMENIIMQPTASAGSNYTCTFHGRYAFIDNSCLIVRLRWSRFFYYIVFFAIVGLL
jgi:hypothetical protein